MSEMNLDELSNELHDAIFDLATIKVAGGVLTIFGRMPSRTLTKALRKKSFTLSVENVDEFRIFDAARISEDIARHSRAALHEIVETDEGLALIFHVPTELHVYSPRPTCSVDFEA